MKIFLTKRAERNYDFIKSYIKEKWGNQTAEEFVQKTDELFRLLLKFPEMGQVEKDRKRENKIIILSFFDVRQNPKKKF